MSNIKREKYIISFECPVCHKIEKVILCFEHLRGLYYCKAKCYCYNDIFTGFSIETRKIQKLLGVFNQLNINWTYRRIFE